MSKALSRYGTLVLVMGLQRHLNGAPGKKKNSLKNNPFDLFFILFHFILQNKTIFRENKPFIVSKNFIILSFRFLTYKCLFKQTKKWSRDILWRHKTVFLRF